MDKMLLFILIGLSANIYGQSLPDSIVGVQITDRFKYSIHDSIPVVRYLDEAKAERNTLLYLNGVLVDRHYFTTLDPNRIKEITVEKPASDEEDYDGKIFVTLKEEYTPSWISLNDLAGKYLDLNKGKSALFMINEKIIDDDYDTFHVDEKYILKIEVKTLTNTEEELDLNVIKLVTRTKEHLDQANTIILR